MRNLLYTVCFLFIVSLFLGSDFVVQAYGQSDCSNWGAPLERKLTNEDVNSPFNPDKDHYGTDYRAADGDNVLSVADGKIWKIGNQPARDLSEPDSRTGLVKRGAGRYVVVEHADGSKTFYAHLQDGSTNHLYEKMLVNKGDIIGKADSTGGVTGPHLHLQYATNGKIFDKSSLKDPNPCLVQCPTGSVTLALSGPDAPQNGSQYTASGGTAPYTWSISKGSITQTGVVTVSGQCGAATITATDSCGNNTGSKDVRMPSGMWVWISDTHYPSPGASCTGGGYPACYPINPLQCETISAAYKTVKRYYAQNPICWGTAGALPGAIIEEHQCPTNPPPTSCECNLCATAFPQYRPWVFGYGVDWIKVYEWRCP